MKSSVQFTYGEEGFEVGMKPKDWPVLNLIFHWFDSANAATEGILEAAKNHRHVKFHLLVAFVVLFGCFLIGIEKFEFIAIALITLLVIVAEMFNSALEVVVDLKSPEKNEKARIAKDIAAGAVLITAVGALIVGYLILWPYFLRIIHEGFWIAKHYAENIAVLAVIIIMILVVMLKAYLGKGHPLKGGCPSGHTAVVFSMWISLTYISTSAVVWIVGLVIALLVTASRLLKNIHSLLDIVVGAALGILTTITLFWIFY
jgi:diacylglycerol kinase (ATP)